MLEYLQSNTFRGTVVDHHKFKASQGYIVGPCLIKHKGREGVKGGYLFLAP